MGGIKININDSFNFKPIKIPARGKLCTHVQVFDLENFLKINSTRSRRILKCPICSKITVEFVIDNFIYSFLAFIKLNAQIFKKPKVDQSPKDDDDPFTFDDDEDEIPWDSVYLLKND